MRFNCTDKSINKLTVTRGVISNPFTSRAGIGLDINPDCREKIAGNSHEESIDL